MIVYFNDRIFNDPIDDMIIDERIENARQQAKEKDNLVGDYEKYR